MLLIFLHSFSNRLCMYLTVHQVSVASILFIDNPVGTGYSYVTHDSAYTTDVHQIAQDLMTTITAFLQQLPDFQVEASLNFCGLCFPCSRLS